MQDSTSSQSIVIERTYDAPVAKVWEALTDNNKIKQWYFQLASFEPKEGFEFEFLAGDANKEFLHKCKITAVIPNKKLAYTWRYDGYPGNSEVTFELFDEGDKTRLKLTHTGVETFPDINDFRKENFVAGWTHITGTDLKNFVEQH